MSFLSSMRSGRTDVLAERERRMADVTLRYHAAAAELGPAIAQAEALVSRLQDIRQEFETDRLLREVAHVQEAQEASSEA